MNVFNIGKISDNKSVTVPTFKGFDRNSDMPTDETQSKGYVLEDNCKSFKEKTNTMDHQNERTNNC